jgi:hypothetical protein
LITN